MIKKHSSFYQTTLRKKREKNCLSIAEPKPSFSQIKTVQIEYRVGVQVHTIQLSYKDINEVFLKAFPNL